MPETYENSFWVEDTMNADDMVLDQNSIDKEIVVDEKDMDLPIMVVEEDGDSDYVEKYLELADREKDSPGGSVAPKFSDEFKEHPDEPIMVVEELVPGSDAVIEEDKDDDGIPEKETDWAHDGDHSKFMVYIIDKKNKIPRHSGETIPGCERAKSYLRSLDNEISKAMRSDLGGSIDEQQIDAVRKEIEKMVEKLDVQINKLKKKTRKAELNVRLVSEGQCDKCESVVPMWHDVANDKLVCMRCEGENKVEAESELEKVATSPVLNVYITAFERAICGIIINSVVSGGKNIEETYNHLKNKYNFLPREELAIIQLVSDYGYPIYLDRGRINENSDPASGDGIDWQTNYHA